MKRVHIIFHGRVQGVGFRYTVEHTARATKVKGWVRNNPDGGVEISAEGAAEDLNGFLEQIEASFASYIRDKTVDWQEATGEFKDFEIRF